MTSFAAFLIETQFSEDDLDRLISAFERRLPRALGSKIYREGGKTGVKKVAGGQAYVYFFGDRAFQVRAKGGRIQGIDVWSKYALDKGPDYTIDVRELDSASLLGAIAKLGALIKSPAEGKIEVKQISESIQLDEMASRVAPADFFKMAVDSKGEEGAKNLTWDEIKAIASENDVLVPAYIRDQKVSRGRWTAEISADTTEREEKKKEPKQDPILYIKVTAQDPVSKKFMATGDNKQAQALYTQLQAAVTTPTPAEVKDPETLYGHLTQLVQMACKGSLRSLLIYGGPGTGKTHTIMKAIAEAGLSKGKDYVKLSGKATPIEIYKTLFMYRDGGMIVFDDLDSMWGNQDATNVLKSALDSSPVREISWVSTNTTNVSRMDDEERAQLFQQIDDQIDTDPTNARIKYPSSFDFKGRVIFISNLKKEEFDSAIMSRSAKINMDLSPAQILERMKKILPTLGEADVPIEKKEELLAHLETMHKRKEITFLTLREFVKGLDIVRSGAPNWKELIQYS